MEREGTRSFVKPLPSFPPASQMTTQLTHSFMTAVAAMAMEVEVLRRANTQQKSPPYTALLDAFRREERFSKRTRKLKEVRLQGRK